jgi:hypothetical protein
MPLSKAALEKKRAYNRKRTKELFKTFSATLPKEEYNEICDYLKSIEMNKVEFVRWAYEELKK